MKQEMTIIVSAITKTVLVEKDLIYRGTEYVSPIYTEFEHDAPVESQRVLMGANVRPVEITGRRYRFFGRKDLNLAITDEANKDLSALLDVMVEERSTGERHFKLFNEYKAHSDRLNIILSEKKEAILKVEKVVSRIEKLGFFTRLAFLFFPPTVVRRVRAKDDN